MPRIGWLVVGIALLGACEKKQKAAKPVPLDAEVLEAPCELPEQEGAECGAVGSPNYISEDGKRAPEPPSPELTAWREREPRCRGVDWYVTAARLLRGGAAPLTANDGATIASAQVALRTAMADPAAPSSARLLAYVSFVHGVAPAEAPALPVDACERLSTRTHEDPALVAYVCGKYDDIPDVGAFRYPDVLVREIEALVAAGEREKARALEAEARAIIDRESCGATEGDLAAVRARLDQSLK